MKNRLTIGSRASPLALTQSRWVAARLMALHPGLTVEIVEVHTTGDRNLGASLSEIGGKGAFTKELEDALLDGRCDLAVHSLKDLPTRLPDDLALLAVPSREDTRDVWIFRDAPREAAWISMARGAIVGTSSLRRRAQLLAARPDFKVIEFRGNVDTRLRKLRDGQADACILAAAGLRRLGLLSNGEASRGPAPAGEAAMVGGLDAQLLDAPGWLPAVGQGALGIEGRAGDERAAVLMAPLHDAGTSACVTAERAFLRGLGAGCQAPVGALAVVQDDQVRLRAAVWSLDGARREECETLGPVADAETLGEAAAAGILSAWPEAVAQ
jgi:hydroxymethylbilane synthase